ncbi:hypothetical protein EYF80_015192 [Liparis tanakae]|uniref:Uncharacterized protein n=1 Tax=Liparis tanakae TaxID=230148 RepID=A0A4Z2IB36_9TELE|nr:hypothetical protein EYF80_015192 [Liparis tanakae]
MARPHMSTPCLAPLPIAHTCGFHYRNPLMSRAQLQLHLLFVCLCLHGKPGGHLREMDAQSEAVHQLESSQHEPQDQESQRA